MKVIITEKPSVAREIASVLNVTETKDGYIQGGNYSITWAYGHLVELCPPEEYGWCGQWTASALPMLPEKFKLRPTHRFNSTTKTWYIDDGVKKQLETIKKLFNAADQIIVATDAGREGELIFRYIYQYLEVKKPFTRLWISSLTRNAIMKGFVDLAPGSKYDNLYHSAKCRSEADWLVGMNASRALSISAATGTFSVGRVQTPTLAMICARTIENKSFVPKPYFKVKILLVKENASFFATSKAIDSKDQATQLLKKIVTATFATIQEVETKEVIEQPPLLHDLTSLQREANKKLSISADDTLKAAQALYEQKYITYPRTGSCYISEDVFESIPQLMEVISKHPVYGIFAIINQPLNRKSVNDRKVTDHHALLITENLPLNLKGNELSVYNLILTRVLKAFYPSCIKESTKLKLDCKQEPFTASGTVIKVEGWRKIDSTNVNDEVEDTHKENEDEQQTLPKLEINEKVKKQSEELFTKKTKPKPLMNEDLLLGAMESCGKVIEDETLREALKICGIGTPATRSNIIETLIHRQYIERQKKLLLPTPKGMAVYDLLKEKQISSPELTGNWERKLNHISMGVEDVNVLREEITDYVKMITVDLLGSAGVLQKVNLSADNSSKFKCPKCENYLKKGEKNFYCLNYKNGCDFKIWLNVSEKKITDTQVRQLLEKGKTNTITGFVSKQGKEFEASLKMVDYKVVFDFTKNTNKETVKT